MSPSLAVKLFSLRNLLIAGVVLALIANLIWRLPKKTPSIFVTDDLTAAPEANIVPTVSNLSAMGMQWKQRLDSLPPEERAQSEARLKEERAFFISAMQLPAAERDAAVKERLQQLMNDPGIQAEWVEERYRMLVKLDPAKRQELFKKYVESKKELKGR